MQIVLEVQSSTLIRATGIMKPTSAALPLIVVGRLSILIRPLPAGRNTEAATAACSGAPPTREGHRPERRAAARFRRPTWDARPFGPRRRTAPATGPARAEARPGPMRSCPPAHPGGAGGCHLRVDRRSPAGGAARP